MPTFPATAALLDSHFHVGKFDDHIPLYRMEEMLARCGIEIARSTQCDWLREAARLLAPIRQAMKVDLLRSRVVRFDETVLPVLALGETRTAYLAAFLGDVDHPHVVFDYWPNRSQQGPLSFLKGYSGYGQADAYKGYDAVFKDGKIIEVGCNAHARRKVYDARTSDSGNAHIAIAYYHDLYAIEREARGRPPEERHQIRQARARPLWDRFESWLDSTLPTVLPKSPIGEALGYIDRQRRALTRYLEDGILDIDNNDTERVLRSVAIGRKNWLFAGNDKAGARHAVFYSLIETCHRHHVNTWRYIQDVLVRVGTTPVSEIAELFPHRWKKKHPDAILPPLDARDNPPPECGNPLQSTSHPPLNDGV